MCLKVVDRFRWASRVVRRGLAGTWGAMARWKAARGLCFRCRAGACPDDSSGFQLRHIRQILRSSGGALSFVTAKTSYLRPAASSHGGYTQPAPGGPVVSLGRASQCRRLVSHRAHDRNERAASLTCRVRLAANISRRERFPNAGRCVTWIRARCPPTLRAARRCRGRLSGCRESCRR